MNNVQQNSIQLEMNFNGSSANRFKDRMDNGTFQVLVEIPAPSAEVKLEQAVREYSEFEYVAAASAKVASALAFTEPSVTGEPAHDSVTFASALCSMDRNAHLMYLRGRDRTRADIEGFITHCYNEGFKNICAVSGETVPGEGAGATSRRVFTESVNILHYLQGISGENTFSGAVINPYKYTPADVYAQYGKLMRKVNQGASFLVTQYGWDMMKLQELRWQLTQRALVLPSLARLLYLTPERASEVCAGKVPGVELSLDMKTVLQREMEHSGSLFSAAQIRRIQIHAAGARLLGYSGIQLAGVGNADLFAQLLQKIDEAIQEFPTFEDWRVGYLEYYARMKMAPYPYCFYKFENLFSTAHAPEELQIRNGEIPACPAGELRRYRLAKLLFSHASGLPASERHLTKKLIVSCRGCNHCRLPQTMYVCPEQCPKGMSNGPCGGSRSDGSCEFYPGHDCQFVKRMRLANELHDYIALEGPYVEAEKERPVLLLPDKK